jgi:hypothetical protein
MKTEKQQKIEIIKKQLSRLSAIREQLKNNPDYHKLLRVVILENELFKNLLNLITTK